jgi:hypothetical protein
MDAQIDYAAGMPLDTLCDVSAVDPTMPSLGMLMEADAEDQDCE